jgi:hypothetical protein
MKSWWRAVVSYPPTWIAGAALVTSVWVIDRWVDPSAGFSIVLWLLAATAVVAWPLTMSATGTLRDLQFAVPEVEEVDPAELDQLTAELVALPDPQPAEQLMALQQKRQSLIRVLERRLDHGEITYARYLATSQLVYTSALHNLREIAVASQSIESIDEQYIDRRLGELDTDDSDAEAAARERTTLERRRGMRGEQRRKIARLLAQNEAALTSIDRTTTALADVPIGKRPEDTDVAMAALEELADRATKYAV